MRDNFNDDFFHQVDHDLWRTSAVKRSMKWMLAAFVGWVVLYATLLGLIGWAIVHFIVKFW